MYNNPFGSIFGSDKPEQTNKPGFLEQDDDPSSSLKRGVTSAEPVPAEPEAVEKKKPSAKLMNEMRERNEGVPKEQVYQPKAVTGKSDFSKPAPQFKAATTIKSVDPEVGVEKAKLLEHKNKQEMHALKRQLKELKRKTKAAKIYKDLLLQYSSLDAKNKKQLHKWIKSHYKAVKLLHRARKMKRLTSETKEVIAALDVEIKHWESLSLLKKKGKDITGKKKLKYYRPKKKAIRTKPAESQPAPNFIPKVSKTPNLVRLAKNGVSQVQGYGDEQAEPIEIVKAEDEKEKRGAVQTFVDNLPDKKYYLNKRKLHQHEEKLRHDIDKHLRKKMEFEWKKNEIEEKLQEQKEDYEEAQEKIKIVLSQLNKTLIDEEITTVLSVLVESRPERFVAIASLLDGLKDSFTRLSQLGQTDPAAKSAPVIEAQQLLNEVTAESQATISDLQTRQGALHTLQTDVSGAPVPQPKPLPAMILLVAEVKAAEKVKAKQARNTKIATILPLVVGGFLLYKFLGG